MALFCVTVNVCPPAVIVPLRGAPRFARTVNDTDPDPVPELVVVIHGALEVAVHVQPADVLTLNDAVSATPFMVRLLGERLKLQLPAVCVTVKVRPAMVSVPVREDVVELAWTLKPALPLPVPLAPDVTVMNEELLTAVQAHPVVVVTVDEPVPPPAAIDCVVGEMLNEHEPAA